MKFQSVPHECNDGCGDGDHSYSRDVKSVYVRGYFRRPPRPKTYAKAIADLRAAVERVMRRESLKRSSVLSVLR